MDLYLLEMCLLGVCPDVLSSLIVHRIEQLAWRPCALLACSADSLPLLMSWLVFCFWACALTLSCWLYHCAGCLLAWMDGLVLEVFVGRASARGLKTNSFIQTCLRSLLLLMFWPGCFVSELVSSLSRVAGLCWMIACMNPLLLEEFVGRARVRGNNRTKNKQ